MLAPQASTAKNNKSRATDFVDKSITLPDISINANTAINLSPLDMQKENGYNNPAGTVRT